MTATYPPDRPLRLGTRGSPLALVQARMAQGALAIALNRPEASITLVPITTIGDRVLDRPLADMGGKALWTKPLDRALMAGEIDAAVHSLKDVETVRPAEIALAALLERADPRDRLIGALSLEALPTGARVGTSSPRRAAQLLALRPDLSIVPLRGNVATRLAKLSAGEADATLLAAAGLDRLGQEGVGTAIDPDVMLPAAGQAAVAIECRADDAALRLALAGIDHPPTRRAVLAERAFLQDLNADCHSPVAAHAAFRDGAVILTAELLTPDGRERVRAECQVASAACARGLADRLFYQASDTLKALFRR